MKDLCTIFRENEKRFLQRTTLRPTEDDEPSFDEVLKVIDEDQRDNDPLYRE